MSKRVAVLGGGIMGTTLALRLAMRGCSVMLFECEDSLLSGASRFNEGKIHLGCLYAASQSLETTKTILTGGLHFFRAIEALLEEPIQHLIAPGFDHYLIHENSVVSLNEVSAYMMQVARLVDEHPDRGLYPGAPGTGDFQNINLEEFTTNVGSTITGCVRVPERSVATQPIADSLIRRASEQPGLELRTRTRVVGVDFDGARGAVKTSEGVQGGFDYVVNALWHGRPAIDLDAIGRCDPEPHHRYRVSLFLEDGPELNVPSAVVAAGPFGDFKNYGGGRFYLSWYPAGLLCESTESAPPTTSGLTAAELPAIAQALVDGLSGSLPALSSLDLASWDYKVAGGWVYAQGRGALDNPNSTLHRRDLMGVSVHGQYISVDTGKYSTAPYMAEQIEKMLLG